MSSYLFASNLVNPSFITMNCKNNIFVGSSTDDIIKEVSMEGIVKDTLLSGNGIFIDKNDYIYITNTTAKTLKKINSDGDEIFVINTGLDEPKGVTVFNDNIYITDGNTIKKINSNLEINQYITGLNNPNGLVFDKIGNLYIANTGSNNIIKITCDNTYSILIDELNEPFDLAISSGNYLLYCSNKGNNTIIKIKLDVEPETKIYVKEEYGLNGPIGIILDKSNNLYVASNIDGKLYKFPKKYDYVKLSGIAMIISIMLMVVFRLLKMIVLNTLYIK